MANLKFYTLHSSLADLGIGINNAFNLSELKLYNKVLYAHVSIYGLFGWFLNLFSITSTPYIILTLQSLSLSLPIYWVYKHYGRLTALAYTLFFPIWFNALFDFHFDHLSVPLLIAFFLFVQSGRFGLAVICAISLALVKEPFALQTAMCGVYLLGVRWNGEMNLKLCIYSIGLIFFGFGYFYITTNYVIPIYSSGERLIWLQIDAYSYLGSNFIEMIRYILIHPVEILVDIITTTDKAIYLIALFGSLGFVSLLRPGPLIVALPIFAISLLSRHEGYYGLGHHYTAGLIAPMLIAFAGGLPRAKIIWQKIVVGRFRLPAKLFTPLLISILVTSHISLAPSPIGRLFWSDKVWDYNYKAYIPTERDAMIKQAIAEFIPTDPDVVISIQNSVNSATLVQRRHFLLFPLGITEEHRLPFFGEGLWPPNVQLKSVMADYVVLDIKRPWFLLDKGCDWLYGKCNDKNKAADYLQWVAKSRKLMDVAFEEDGFLILRRKGENSMVKE